MVAEPVSKPGLDCVADEATCLDPHKQCGPEWQAHDMAAPETVYARDGDVHLATSVGGGPDLLFVPTATFPIGLLWGQPMVAGHPPPVASFRRLSTSSVMLVAVGCRLRRP